MRFDERWIDSKWLLQIDNILCGTNNLCADPTVVLLFSQPTQSILCHKLIHHTHTNIHVFHLEKENRTTHTHYDAISAWKRKKNLFTGATQIQDFFLLRFWHTTLYIRTLSIIYQSSTYIRFFGIQKKNIPKKVFYIQTFFPDSEMCPNKVGKVQRN